MKEDLLFYDAYEEIYKMASTSETFRDFCIDAYGADFSQDGFSDVKQIDMIVPFIMNSDAHVLDIGCGNGKMIKYLGDKTGAHIHSLLFILLLVAIMNYFSWDKSIMMGVSVGVASHLLLDMATKNGVKLFFPLPVTVRFPLTTRTGGTVESIVFGILSVLTVYFGYGAFTTYF